MLVILLWYLLISCSSFNKLDNIKDMSFSLIDIVDNKFAKKIQRQRYDANCKLIFEMNTDEMKRARRLNKRLYATSLLPDSNFIFATTKCEGYKKIRGFNLHKISPFEYEFPLAFSILTYDKVEQLER